MNNNIWNFFGFKYGSVGPKGFQNFREAGPRLQNNYHLSLLPFVEICKLSVMEKSQFLAQKAWGQMASRITPVKQTVQLFLKDEIQICRPVVSECYHLTGKQADKELEMTNKDKNSLVEVVFRTPD